MTQSFISSVIVSSDTFEDQTIVERIAFHHIRNLGN